jgi:nucleoid-associated protein YgaU
MTEQKAEIFRIDDPGKKVVCQFNPNDFSISKSVKWVYQTADGKNVGNPEFGGGEAQDLTVNLIFDSTDTGSDVRQKYAELLKMAQIDETHTNTVTRKGEPPQCKFQWGSFLSFTGVIKTISQNFTLFKADGTPLRVKMQVIFSETPVPRPGQNPTTRTEPRKIWVVREGETLPWIAYQEYGEAGHWRHIAETNGLDNPMELRPGQVLKLVPLH